MPNAGGFLSKRQNILAAYLRYSSKTRVLGTRLNQRRVTRRTSLSRETEYRTSGVLVVAVTTVADALTQFRYDLLALLVWSGVGNEHLTSAGACTFFSTVPLSVSIQTTSSPGFRSYFSWSSCGIVAWPFSMTRVDLLIPRNTQCNSLALWRVAVVFKQEDRRRHFDRHD